MSVALKHRQCCDSPLSPEACPHQPQVPGPVFASQSHGLATPRLLVCRVWSQSLVPSEEAELTWRWVFLVVSYLI